MDPSYTTIHWHNEDPFITITQSPFYWWCFFAPFSCRCWKYYIFRSIWILWWLVSFLLKWFSGMDLILPIGTWLTRSICNSVSNFTTGCLSWMMHKYSITCRKLPALSLVQQILKFIANADFFFTAIYPDFLFERNWITGKVMW